MTWSISAAGPSLSRPPHQSSSRLYSCSRLSSTLQTWNTPITQQFSYLQSWSGGIYSVKMYGQWHFKSKCLGLWATVWRITGYETGPGQNDLAVLLTHRDLYCLGCNSSGLRVINPSPLPMDNGRGSSKGWIKAGVSLAPADHSGNNPCSGRVL